MGTEGIELVDDERFSRVSALSSLEVDVTVLFLSVLSGVDSVAAIDDDDDDDEEETDDENEEEDACLG